MVERDVVLAAYEHSSLHIMHVSALESVRAIQAAQVRGVTVSAEVTPHHLCLTDDSVRSLDANMKMNPPRPVRGASGRRSSSALREGTIACIATDHAPHARHEKESPFEEAPFGVTGLETAFAALNTHLVGPGVRLAGDGARADVRRAGARVRPAGATDRGGRARQSRRARPRGGVDGDRGRVPLSLGRTPGCSARPAPRQGDADGRRRPAGVLHA